MFSVIVKTLEGGNHEFHVDNEIKVLDFKRNIEETLHIPVTQQRLIFQGRVLSDDAQLLACGVRDKVVHLVPRPPPPATSTTSEFVTTPTTSTGNSTGTIDMQQVIQDLFSGLGEVGRNMRIARDGNHPTPSISHTASITARQQTFSHLLNQANVLLRETAESLNTGNAERAATESSHAPESPASSSFCGTARTTEWETQNRKTSFPTTSLHDPSPMTVDNSDTATQGQTSGTTHAITDPGVGDSENAEPSLRILADLFGRYRQFWQSAEPYFERWQKMLDSESELAQRLVGTAPKSTVIGDGTNTTKEAKSRLFRMDDGSEPWRPGMSRLLHLNAHMLHLLSDFVVTDVAQPQNQGITPVSNDSEFGETINLEQPAGQTEPLTTVNNFESIVRRVLSIPDNDAHLLRARVNIEPVVSFESQTPIVESIQRNHREGPTPAPPDRRRSQSAASSDRRHGSTVPQATEDTRPPQQLTSFLPGGAGIVHRVDIPFISMNLLNIPAMVTQSVTVTTSSQTTNVQPATIAIPTTTPTTTLLHSTQPINRNATGSVTSPTAFVSSSSATGTVLSADPFLPCNSRHFINGSDHVGFDSRNPFGLPFAIPTLAFSPDVNLGSGQQATSGLTPTTNTNSQASVTSASSGSATQGNASAIPAGSPSFLAANLTQQLVSLVTAAANAATSAAFPGGSDPLNIFLASPPVQFTVASNSPSYSTVTSTQDTGATELITPSWVGSSRSSRLVLSADNRILNTFISALIETIWFHLCSFIASSTTLSDDRLRLPDDFVWPEEQSHSQLPVGLLTDLLSAARSSLRGRSGSLLPSTLNGLRVKLRHLLGHATHSADESYIVASLTELVFDGWISDAAVQSETTEARLSSCLEYYSISEQIVDVRSSLASLFKSALRVQLDLWNTSPTNTGFGSTLLLTLTECCVDFLCLSDLIIDQLIACLQVDSLNPVTHSSSSDRCATRDFSRLLDHLSRFVGTLPGSNASVPFFELLVSAVRQCVDMYNSMDSATIALKKNRLRESFLIYRSTTFPKMEVDDQNESDLNQLDMDDSPYLDASSDLTGSETPASQFSSNKGDGTQNAPPLPPWTLKADISCPLDPHPDAGHLNQVDPEGWHAVLPTDWIDVVANDTARMKSEASSRLTLDRFSDAYVTGMPVKRRRIIEERSSSNSKPELLLMECLSDAIHGCARGYPGSQTAFEKQAIRLPDDRLNMVLSLRDFVTTRISTRLASDPDFDPIRYPSAQKAFGRMD